MIDREPVSSQSELKFLVAGVARNCEKTIQKDVLRLSESLKGCKALSWLVVESDSSDKTLDALSSLERDVADFRFLSFGSLQQSIPIRTERIALCRNAYLDELKSNPIYSEVDFVVIADFDGVNDLITPEGVESCWTRSDWDVCTANQRGPYYDIWALRHPIWNPNDCWKQYDFLRSHNTQREVAAWAAMYTKMITIGETEEWIPVDSAFGGLAIYRRRALDDVRYAGVDESGEPLCEHVWLHSQIRSKGYRIFINPKLINTANTDQAFQRSLPQTLRRYFLDLRHQAKVKLLNLAPRSAKIG
jgi:hypothetical protein